jgi:hypothetical protein
MKNQPAQAALLLLPANLYFPGLPADYHVTPRNSRYFA